MAVHTINRRFQCGCKILKTASDEVDSCEEQRSSVVNCSHFSPAWPRENLERLKAIAIPLIDYAVKPNSCKFLIYLIYLLVEAKGSSQVAIKDLEINEYQSLHAIPTLRRLDVV